MKICEENHNSIAYTCSKCPLCYLTRHNNQVHDFIESKGYQGELVEYQKANPHYN